MHRRTRRLFLTDVSRTTAGLIVATSALAACSTDDAPATLASDAASTPTSTSPASPATAATASAAEAAVNPSAAELLGPTTPSIVEIDFVAAYLLVRGGEAALVDTGIAGSEGLVEEVLTGLGLGWGDVGSIIVTHNHGDHAGSLLAISELASGASIYGGAADIPTMQSAREVTAVGDGDAVFGLQIIETPGHTPGHLSVYDPAARFVVTGDALVSSGPGGDLQAPPAEFTADMEQALASLTKLGGFDIVETLVGHGFPAAGKGSADIAALADA